MSADGRLPLPKDLSSDSPSLIHNITIFLYSYDTGKNFTITNGTASANNASLGDIMLQEPGSTVKHVNWDWPDCLAGDGQPKDVSDARGVYNVSQPAPAGALDERAHGLTREKTQISIRQNFRLNGSEYYTIFDLPISVTNRISNNTLRPSCDGLLNPMLAPDQINMSAANAVGVLFAPGDASQLEVTGNGSGPDGFGVTAQGLGGAGRLAWWGDASWICLLGLALAVVL